DFFGFSVFFSDDGPISSFFESDFVALGLFGPFFSPDDGTLSTFSVGRALPLGDLGNWGDEAGIAPTLSPPSDFTALGLFAVLFSLADAFSPLLVDNDVELGALGS